jgi:ATP-dependent RNA helicase RhlE
VQAKALKRGVNVLVATPGRLEDLMNDGAARLHHVT